MPTLSRISSKNQITVPKAVREHLEVGPGDLLAFDVDDRVTLRKVETFDQEFHEAVTKTLDEWNSPEDEEAFRDL